MKSLNDMFQMMFASGAKFDPERNSFDATPASLATMQMLDQQQQENDKFFNEIYRMHDDNDI